MPIDPRIPLGGQPVQPVDFWRVMAGAQQLAAQSHELRQAQRAEQDEMALRDALAKYQENPDEAVLSLQRSGHGPAALKLSEAIAKARKESADALKVQLDNDTAAFALGSQVLDAVKDKPEMFPMASRILGAISPQVAQLLGPEYDPQKIATLRDIGLKESEKHNRRAQAFTEWKDARDYAKSEPDRIARDVKLLGTWLSSASPGQYELFYENAPGIGIDKRAIAMFDPKYSPEAIRKAELLTMTPEERATLSGQEAARTETARHNRATEATARGNLAVAQENLKLRAAELAKGVAGEDGQIVKLPAAAAQMVAGLEQSLSMLTDLDNLKKDEWLGPVSGRFTQLRISTPGAEVSPSLARFAAQTATLKNAVVKAITGAQMSEPEAKRIMKQIPDFTDKPVVWTEKLKATQENMKLMRERMFQLNGHQAPPLTSPAPSSQGGGGRFEILSVQ